MSNIVIEIKDLGALIDSVNGLAIALTNTLNATKGQATVSQEPTLSVVTPIQTPVEAVAPSVQVAPTPVQVAPLVQVTPPPAYTLEQLARGGVQLRDNNLDRLMAMLAHFNIRTLQELPKERYDEFANMLLIEGVKL